MKKVIDVEVTLYSKAGAILATKTIPCGLWRDMSKRTLEIRALAKETEPLKYTAKQTTYVGKCLMTVELDPYGSFTEDLNKDPWNIVLCSGDTVETRFKEEDNHALLWSVDDTGVFGNDVMTEVLWGTEYEIMAFDDAPEWEGEEVVW